MRGWPLPKLLPMVPPSFADNDGTMTPEPPCEAFHDLLRGMAALSGNRIVADIARLYGKGAPPDHRFAYSVPVRIARTITSGPPAGSWSAPWYAFVSAAVGFRPR